MARWAEAVAGLLKPGGRLFIREGHPMLWALDDARTDGLVTVGYPYFEQAEATVFDASGTYVETEAEFAHTVTHQWNHGLGQIVTALSGPGWGSPAWSSTTACPGRLCPG